MSDNKTSFYNLYPLKMTHSNLIKKLRFFKYRISGLFFNLVGRFESYERLEDFDIIEI